MEELLHYVWKHRLFPLADLLTTDGQFIEVVDVGLSNTDAGPDFFNAKIRIGGTLWVGDVEVHNLSSDWVRHAHSSNPAYNTVILHVVGKADCVVSRPDGTVIPQLELPCPASVQAHYAELQKTDAYPRCHQVIPSLSSLTVRAWMTALQTERLEQKTEQVTERLNRCDGNWEDAFFVTLARNFGFGLNGDVFERWASSIPFRAVDKHRDDLHCIEAFFFGQAGLLSECTNPDAYTLGLRETYTFLSNKFDLKPLDASLWRFLRLRPGNFPHVRIAQLAQLCYRHSALLSRIVDTGPLNDVKAIFKLGVSPYWETHYRFSVGSSHRTKRLSDASLDLLVVNTVVPFLYAYGTFRGDAQLQARAASYWEELKPENNAIIRMWKELGLEVNNAADSQALIQLKKEYCDCKRCLNCRFGYAYLKQSVCRGACQGVSS